MTIWFLLLPYQYQESFSTYFGLLQDIHDRMQQSRRRICHPFRVLFLCFRNCLIFSLAVWKWLHCLNELYVRFLCSIVRELVDKVTRIREEDTGEDSIGDKCSTLKEKLSALLKSLGRESAFASNLSVSTQLINEFLWFYLFNRFHKNCT